MKEKRYITQPFDRHRIPPKQNIFFMPFIWIFSWIMGRFGKLKIRKIRMKGLKPPYLVLGTHHSFMDFYITPLALFPHRANYISELEGFENFGEELYRQAGCLGTRKFVTDMALIRNIKRVVDRGDILVLYPEARYANVGTNSQLPLSVGKLAKMLNVPVVGINMKGNYLQSPIWNVKKRKEAYLHTEIQQLFTKNELQESSLEEVQQKTQEYLTYDEYRWQQKEKMKITTPDRAEGIELVLYRCIYCETDFAMDTKGADLFCTSCGSTWHMTPLGMLEQKTEETNSLKMTEKRDVTIIHIPDWYEWQRQEVMKEIDRGAYSLDIPVEIDSLPNAKNFIPLGTGRLKHTEKGFRLTFRDYMTQQIESLSFTPKNTLSVHTEYNYRDKGQCITLSTVDNTYFLFPKEAGFNATKIQFATEYLFELAAR